MTETANGTRDLRDAIGAAHAEKHDLEAEQLREARTAHADKHVAEGRAVDVAIESERNRLKEHRVTHDAAHSAHEALHNAFSEAHKQQHSADGTALKAATEAMDKRLTGMNEFRDQLRDQSATFVRREMVDQVEAQVERRYEELRALIATEREERRANEGTKRGIGQSTAVIVGAITLAATIISVVIVLANFATGG